MSQGRVQGFRLSNFSSNTIYNASPEERHVNVSRYLDEGICPKLRKKQMETQLRNLLNVNDAPTLPNPRGNGSVDSRIVFSHLLSKVTG